MYIHMDIWIFDNFPDTAEYKTIIHSTPALRTAVEHHLTNLSGHLLAKHLINSGQDKKLRNKTQTECERAAALVEFVADKVEENSDNYHSFINVLEEDKMAFRVILKCMNDAYHSFAGGDH